MNNPHTIIEPGGFIAIASYDIWAMLESRLAEAYSKIIKEFSHEGSLRIAREWVITRVMEYYKFHKHFPHAVQVHSLGQWQQYLKS